MSTKTLPAPFTFSCQAATENPMIEDKAKENSSTKKVAIPGPFVQNIINLIVQKILVCIPAFSEVEQPVSSVCTSSRGGRVKIAQSCKD